MGAVYVCEVVGVDEGANKVRSGCGTEGGQTIACCLWDHWNLNYLVV